MEDPYRDFIIKGGQLIQYTGNDTIVFVPKNVSDIGEEAFCGNTHIKGIVFPSGVRTIRDRAFADCVNLTYIYFPEELGRIGSRVFANTNLKSLSIPESVWSVKIDTFEGMPSPYVIRFFGSCPFSPIGEKTVFSSDHPTAIYYSNSGTTWNFIRNTNNAVIWIPWVPEKEPDTELYDILSKEIKTTDKLAFLIKNDMWKVAFEAAIRDFDDQFGLREFYRSCQKKQTDSSGYYLYDGSGGPLEITINFLRMVISPREEWQVKYDVNGSFCDPEYLEPDEMTNRVLPIPFDYACTDWCGDIWQKLDDMWLEEGIADWSDDLICIRESSQDVPGKYTTFTFDVSYKLDGAGTDTDGELTIGIYGYEFPERHVTGQDE
ncbi:MAG: leucine-rich repeat domain-containing protein [Solobacterium sp.]|nr:leucine-rich repeat domain-containing protein [Solobacterium sp.]